MDQYVPDIYQKSIYTIDYAKLLNRGIKCLLFDLDNTIAPYKENKPTKKANDLFIRLKQKGFVVIIFSNSSKERVKPFKEELQVDCCHRAWKPSIKKFYKIMNDYNFTESEIALIGDQMLTDVLGGNKVGITTILVNPVSKKDFILTKFNRIREKHIMKKLRDHELFSKGRYYD